MTFKKGNSAGGNKPIDERIKIQIAQVGINLYNIRTSMCLSQRELSRRWADKKVGARHAQSLTTRICNLENGTKSVTLASLFEIADALDVPIVDLLQGCDNV